MNLQQFALAAALLTAGNAFAQSVDFGRATQPSDAESVDELIYYGEDLEFIGGYFEGDTVGDFTVYDFDGTPLNLYQTLENEKPTLIISVSVSCPRATNGFLPGAEETGLYSSFQQLINEHYDDFNWILVYGVEAHPALGECPSNCPPGAYNDTTVVQHETYLYRRYAAGNLQNSPEHVFPFPIYADNPDNAVYNNFFQRPFGLCAVNCNGVVELRGDWAHTFIHAEYAALLALIEASPCADAPIDGDNDDEENPDGEVTSITTIAAANALRAWPNPAGETVRLSVPTSFGSAVNIRMFDNYGRVVHDQTSAAGEHTLSLQNLAKGVFVVEITGNGQSERLRLVHR